MEGGALGEKGPEPTKAPRDGPGADESAGGEWSTAEGRIQGFSALVTVDVQDEPDGCIIL